MSAMAQRRTASATAIMMLLAVLQFVLFAVSPSPAGADGGDFSLDFAAAAPYSYSHTTGGGAWDDKTIGVNKDIVESLEGGDFACGDIVTYMQQIVVDDGAVGVQSIEVDYKFLANSTGQPGVAHADVVSVQVNRGSVQDLIEGSHADTGLIDDGGSVATNVAEGFSPSGTAPFSGAETLDLTVSVTDLEASEHVIVRIDVLLSCKAGSRPTGNLQASLISARVTAPAGDAISAGNQTVPFKQVGKISTPGIEINKTPDLQSVVAGSDVTFTITVENTGDVALTAVTVTDVLTPDCDEFIGDLAIDAIETYECTLAGVAAGFTNVAVVVGTSSNGDVNDSDDAVVAVTTTPPPPPTPVTVVVSGTCVVTDGGSFARVTVDDIDPDGDVTVTIGGTAVLEDASADLALDTVLTVVASSASGDFAPTANVGSINVSSDTCDVPPPPPIPVTVVVSGTCVTGQDGAGNGFLAVSISHDLGATVTVNGSSYSVSTSNIAVPAPGSYGWTAGANGGFELSTADEGTVNIDDCSEVPPPSVVCPIPDLDGVVARVLNKGGYIYADRGADDADTGPFALTLAAGVYDVYLTSWDNHTGRPIDSTQTQEQYFVRGWYDGLVVWQSASIDDLPDDQDLLTQLVNAGVSIPALDEVGAVHTAYPHQVANSHQPVCVVFVPVTGTTTTTQPPTTTTTQPPTTPPTNPPVDQKSALGDYVWFDADEDGAQDAGEEPVPGAMVKLLSPAGQVLATDVTDVNGKYLFTGLDAGTYRVEVCLAGSTFTAARASGVTNDKNSDVDGVGEGCGRTALISLPAGVTDLTWDAGIVVEVLGIQIEPTTTTVVGSTTTIEPITVGTLPFTGAESARLIWIALASLIAGVVTLAGTRFTGTESSSESVAMTGWSNQG